jgi:hypothetical protein
VPRVPATVEARVREAYTQTPPARPGRGKWCTLTELRKRLADLPSEEVDAALDRMLASGLVYLEPDMLRRRLTGEDRAAAIRLGGENRHLIWFT